MPSRNLDENFIINMITLFVEEENGIAVVLLRLDILYKGRQCDILYR